MDEPSFWQRDIRASRPWTMYPSSASRQEKKYNMQINENNCTKLPNQLRKMRQIHVDWFGNVWVPLGDEHLIWKLHQLWGFLSPKIILLSHLLQI
jgi:hypothetical protein